MLQLKYLWRHNHNIWVINDVYVIVTVKLAGKQVGNNKTWRITAVHLHSVEYIINLY